MDFHSIFNSRCVHHCSLNYGLVKLKKIKHKSALCMLPFMAYVSVAAKTGQCATTC